MRYHGDRHVLPLFLAPEGGHPIWEENFIEKKYQKCKVLFLSHTSKHYKAQQINVRLINMIPFPLSYHKPIKKHFTTWVLCWAYIHFWSQSQPFLQPPNFLANHCPFYNYNNRSVAFYTFLLYYQADIEGYFSAWTIWWKANFNCWSHRGGGAK